MFLALDLTRELASPTRVQSSELKSRDARKELHNVRARVVLRAATPLLLAVIGLVMLWCRSDSLCGLQNALAAVGKMALTNYLSHSVICLFIFTGAGLALFGQFERAELYLIVLAIWTFQLVTSPLWLNRFRFGPLEFIWRWMTYGARPPQTLPSSPRFEPS